MERPIFSLDVETSGPLPGKHSLVSIGVHEILSWKGFYAELKPEPGEAFEDWPMSVITGKLVCVSPEEKAAFESGAGWGVVASALKSKWEPRKDALFRLRNWMSGIADVSDYDSYDVMAWPSSFDASFILASAGLSKMSDVPCKFSWLCLSSVKRTVKTLVPDWKPAIADEAEIREAMCREGFAVEIAAMRDAKHNAYFDAVAQGLEWLEVEKALRSLRA